MSTTFSDMGFMRWPLTFALVIVVALTGWSAMRLVGRHASADLRTKAWVDAILFWGVFALVTGVLGTLIGIIVAAQSIERAGEAPSVLVWGGVKVAISTSVAGALILALAGLGWFVLQLRWRLLAAAASRA
jgi:hypothetical protein